MSRQFDVIIIGAGHAGCEAALASARLGVGTALVSMDISAAAKMSCNPSIGGIAKSHIVFELDALGGEMARNTDYTGIQFRVLNTRKGPAVQANRAQCDKDAYSARIRAVLEQQPNLSLIQGEAVNIIREQDRIAGIILASGETIEAKCIVITAGTFIRGMIHIGFNSQPGGRAGEAPANALGESLAGLGLKIARLKTGTPPRLHADSIDWAKTEIQPGLEPPTFFSAQAREEYRLFHVEQLPDAKPVFHVEQFNSALCPWPLSAPQIPCYLTHTTEETHDIIRRNLARSALYGGIITGTGARYCPSIEDKVVKFPEKLRHHVFIEPEGRNSISIYPNGISNSLPKDAQEEMVHSIPGLQRAKILKWAYAIEYDFFDPTQLHHSLESKLLSGLFLAGQVNGTTGYEEAAGQGFIAGVNAALKCLKRESFVLGRDEAYIGVMIDDLVTKGTDEPYRMFTSRAEYRLTLRQDNARFRLHSRAKSLGLAAPAQLAQTEEMENTIEREFLRMRSARLSQATLEQVLKRPTTKYWDLPGADRSLATEVIEQMEILAKYDGYIRREAEQIRKAQNRESDKIPDWLDFDTIPSMRFESRQKLKRVRPRTFGQALRIPGVNPVDLSLIAIAIKRGPATAEIGNKAKRPAE